jgi:hypothetical protein
MEGAKLGSNDGVVKEIKKGITSWKKVQGLKIENNK